MRNRFVRLLFASVALLAVWEPRAAFAQGPLTNGGNHAGAISTPGEIDEWTFTAALGDSILLSLGEVLPSGPDPGFAPWIRLRRPDGVEIASDIGTLAATIYTTAPLSGTYTVLVRDSTINRPGTALGDYLLHYIGVPGTPTVPGGDHGGPLTNGGNHPGAIHRADLDPWTFTAAQNDAILVTIGEVITSEIDPNFNPWIRIYGPTGALLESDIGVLTGTLYLTAPLSGTYTVVVADSNVNREGSALGDYILHFVKVPGTLTIPSGDNGGTLNNGGNHLGRIGAAGDQPALQRGDLDPWTFTAAQNDAILVTIGEVIPGEIDPNFNPWIRIYGPTGALLGSDIGTLTATLNVTAPLSGTYTVVVADSNVNREGSALGDYILHFVKVPGTLTIPSGDNGGALTSGGNHLGRIGAPGDQPALQRGDLDPWMFTAAQGDSIVVTIGEVIPGEIDPGFNPWIRLYGPNGALLGSDIGTLAATLAVTAPLSGTYTVVVADSNVNREGSAVGDYVLHLVKIPGPSIIPAGDNGGPVSDGVTYTGRIGAPGSTPTLQRGDLDPWTFPTTQGRAVTVNVSEVLPTGEDPGFNPLVRVYGPTGTIVGSSTGVLNASVNFTVPSSGLHTVVVADSNINREGAAVGDYTIVVHGVDGTGQPPTAQNDVYTTARNTSLVIAAPGVLANDNPNGAAAMTAQLETPVSSGTLSLLPSGGFTYTPANGFVGTATFTYRAATTFGVSNIAVVTITVTAPTPTTVDDAYDVVTANVLAIAAPGVLGNDLANGGGALTAQLVSPPASGSLVLNPSGAFSYTPNAGFAGSDSFTYRAVSSVGPGTTATVTITVHPEGVRPPTNLYVASVVGNTVTIRWTPPAVGPAATGFELEGALTPGGPALASIPMGVTPAFIFQAPSGSFFIRVRTVAGAERSGPSNEVPLHVNVPVPPSPPANLLGMVSGSTLGLAWRNTFGGGTPSGLILDVGGAATLSIPLGLTDTFTFNGVPPGTYTLSLRAVNGAGVSSSSNSVTLQFPQPCSGAPETPTNFVAYRVGNTITVLWDPAAVGSAPTSYVLNVTGSFTASIPTPTRQLSGGVGPGTYSISVIAVNACGASAPTDVQTVLVP